jgi:8-oxo-dGTP pyrophosphatase MutT (NUDIX family)
MSGLEQAQRSSPLDFAWRLVFRFGFSFARIWWRLLCPRHEGALVALYVGRALLLVRQSYRAEWNFPGGSIRKGETPEAAARRELMEEIGLAASRLVPAGAASGLWDGRRDRVHFFKMQLDQPPKLHLDNREIIAAKFVSLRDLAGIPVTGPVAAYVAMQAGGADDCCTSGNGSEP